MKELTPRELQVLQWIAEGHSNQTIAAMSFLSPNTIRTHAQNILIKLHAHRMPHAVAIGYSAGWLHKVDVPDMRYGRPTMGRRQWSEPDPELGERREWESDT